MGGGARDDLLSLVVLRPLAALACAAGLLGLTRADFARYRALFLLVLAAIALTALQLIPLPPALWQALPGRDVVGRIDAAAGLEVWRPLTMDPGATWNALFSLSVPLAVLLLGAQLPGARLRQLIAVFLAIGLLSGVLGVLQVVGPARGPLYLYRIANFDAAIGLFANRNHQAIYLATLFPMLAVFASRPAQSAEQRRRQLWGCAIAAAALLPFLLNAGSRSGLVLGGIGLIAAYALYRPEEVRGPAKRTGRKFNPAPLIAVAGAILLGALTLIVSRASSFQRLLHGDEQDEVRLRVWGPIAEMVARYFPVGSGFGSFADVFKIGEPRANLDTSYLNHAHNDWLELAMTGGAAGLVLLAAALVPIARRGWRAWFAAPAGRRAEAVLAARLGATVLAMFAIGSIVDYPLRTPSLTATAVIALLWLWSGTNETSGSPDLASTDDGGRVGSQRAPAAAR